MSEAVLLLKELDGIILVCYERQEFNKLYEVVWTYEIVIKANAKIGININYILVRDVYSHKERKVLKELQNPLSIAIETALSRNIFFKMKIDEDSVKLSRLFKELTKKDAINGK